MSHLRRPPGRGPSAYSCPAGHSFDLAREGYVHLLPANRMHSKMPGDDKGMAAARGPFLSKDYYAPLRTPCAASPWPIPDPRRRCWTPAAARDTTPAGSIGPWPGGAVRDHGGTDISKAILRRAAKREKDVEFAVASSYHLPLADGAVELLLDCFSPWPSRSSTGCCRRGRFRVCGTVRKSICGELKQVLYDRPYPNQVKQTPLSRVFFVPGDPPCGVGDPSALSGGHPRPVPDDAVLLENAPGRSVRRR